MSKSTAIAWTQHTWNPWLGCQKVSDGCKFCYAARDFDRYALGQFREVHKSKTRFRQPLTWPEPGLVFTCSWSDWFIEQADEWRDEAWDIIKRTPHLTFQILTKRPERIAGCLPDDWGIDGYPNVWLGVSVENQATANERIPLLVKVPARVRFLSVEPLLERINLLPVFGQITPKCIDWIIVGGESGNSTGKHLYRECRLEWICKVGLDAMNTGAALFVKQMGSHIAKEMHFRRDPHGKDFEQFPPELQVRQYPDYDKRTTIKSTTIEGV